MTVELFDVDDDDRLDNKRREWNKRKGKDKNKKNRGEVLENWCSSNDSVGMRKRGRASERNTRPQRFSVSGRLKLTHSRESPLPYTTIGETYFLVWFWSGCRGTLTLRYWENAVRVCIDRSVNRQPSSAPPYYQGCISFSWIIRLQNYIYNVQVMRTK